MIESLLYIALPISLTVLTYIAIRPSRVKLFYNKQINCIDLLQVKARSNVKLADKVPDQKIKLLDLILDRCPTISGEDKFVPTPWLRNGHLQTVYTSYRTDSDFHINYDREVFKLEDGGEVALDWFPNKPSQEEKDDSTPIVIILHGLTGNSQELYCRSTVQQLTSSKKFRTVVFNYRGCGGMELLTPRLYNAGDSRDLIEALAHISELTPKAPRFAVGFSLGANLLVKYLGEMGENTPLSGAMSIANPNDLLDCSRQITSQYIQKTFYDPVLGSGLVKLFAKHRHYLKDHIAEEKWVGVSDFDRGVTIKFSGHATVNDYYRWASSCQFVTKVRVPLLIFNAIDDPVSPHLAIPYMEAKHNPYILLATTDVGGHIGWWTGFYSPTFWFCKMVQEYFETLNEAYTSDLSKKYLD